MGKERTEREGREGMWRDNWRVVVGFQLVVRAWWEGKEGKVRMGGVGRISLGRAS